MRKNRTKRRRTRRRRRMRGGAWYNPMTWGQTTNPAGGEAEGGWFSGWVGKKKKADSAQDRAIKNYNEYITECDGSACRIGPG